jgi:hypothetical protein
MGTKISWHTFGALEEEVHQALHRCTPGRGGQPGEEGKASFGGALVAKRAACGGYARCPGTEEHDGEGGPCIPEAWASEPLRGRAGGHNKIGGP